MTETNATGARAPLRAAFEAFSAAHGTALQLLAADVAGWRYYQAGAAYGAGEERARLTPSPLDALTAENARLRAALERIDRMTYSRAELVAWKVERITREALTGRADGEAVP